MAEHFVLDYDSINYETVYAAMVAGLRTFTRQFMDIMTMTVERFWCSWICSVVALMMVSHLGLRPTRPTARSEKKIRRTYRCKMKLQLKAMLFASWACSGHAMEGQGQGEQAFLQRSSTYGVFG